MQETTTNARARTHRRASSGLSDRRYREMMTAGLDLLDQGVTLFDRRLGLVGCNRAFLDLLDFPEALAQPGVSFEAFMRYNAERGEYGPGDPDALVSDRVTAARRFSPHETRRRRPNGTLLSIRGYPLPHQGFITVYTDISESERQRDQIERHQAELEEHIARRTAELVAANAELTIAIERNREITAALRYSEERLRQITDSIPAHIAYFDAECICRYANRHYAAWFGARSEELIDRPIREILGEQNPAQAQAWLDRALAGEEVSYEYVLERPAGDVRHARSTLVPDRGPDGAVVGCFVHAIEITEQRRTEKALMHAQKMEAIGQLTGGLAHDLNNMLTVVIGNLEGLREAFPDPALASEFVEPTLETAARGTALIKRLLTFSREQPISSVPVEINAVVAGMTRLIRRSLPETINISTVRTATALVARIDPYELESCLLNLVLNARDAMPDGGELRILCSLETLTESELSDIRLPPGDYVRVAVTDSGHGMDAATLGRVFEPFFTTKAFGEGSGLGLAMVYGFAKQSGGAVRVRSRAGIGTTVELLLPCVAGVPVAPHSAASPRELSTTLAGHIVLLVEDDPEVRRVIRKQLAALGCQVIEAASGDEAGDMIEAIAAISMVLSDVVMPGGLNGRGLARFVRRYRPEVMVALMSGYAERAESAVDQDIPIIDKPFTRARLAEFLDHALRSFPYGRA